MDKFKEIRPIVLGLLIKDNKILVGEFYDKVRNQTFYRSLGGGIEFLEKSEDALKREFKEEINVDIKINNFIGISENIFTLRGKNAHEIAFIYSINIDSKDFKNEYHIEETNCSYTAKWIDINDFKNKSKILYPEEILKYL